MSEPTTEAGRRMAGEWAAFGRDESEYQANRAELAVDVVRVERQAVSAERARIAEAIYEDIGYDLRKEAQAAERALHCVWPTIVLRILAIVDRTD